MSESQRVPKPNRRRVHCTLTPKTFEKLTDWAVSDQKGIGNMIDDVVAFAAKNGFRDED